MMAYCISTDLVDDHLAVGERQAIKCLKRFVVAIIQVLDEEYLRAANDQDTARSLDYNNARGFSGMLASTDFMNWSRKDYPAMIQL
jgi:hypothetical protein